MWISESKLLFKILLSSFMMIFLIACSSDSDEKNVDQFTNVSENTSSQNNNNETEPKIFESSKSEAETETKEPEMFEESNLEEDFEIPAFLRRQKN